MNLFQLFKKKETKDSPKEFINPEFNLEKHNLDEYLEQKAAYQKGVDDFDSKFKTLSPTLLINLRHEAGMAEIYRNKGQLLKYSIHIYRQIEIIYSEIFSSQSEIQKIHNKIDWTHWSTQGKWYASIKRKMVSYYSGGDYLQLTDKNKDFLFKSIFYFEAGSHNKTLKPHAKKMTSQEKVYLNAFEAIHYFRNLGSHNNTDNKTLRTKTGDQSENRFRQNPDLILNSTYFQRYVDMVLLSYIEHLKTPFY